MESVQQGAYSLSFNTFTDLLVKFFCLNKIHIFRFVDILPPRLNEKCIMLLININTHCNGRNIRPDQYQYQIDIE